MELDLAALAGTGPHRRIRKRDVLAAASNQGRAPSSTRRPANATIAENGTGEAISQMRLRVAETVSVSRRTIPAFTLDRWVESTALHEARVAIGSLVERESGVKPTVTDFLLQAMADALRRYRTMLDRWV